MSYYVPEQSVSAMKKAATLTGPLLQAGGADLGGLEPRGAAGCCSSPGTVRTWKGEGTH